MERTVLPIPLHEKNRRLIQAFRETLPVRPDGMNHLELSRWQQNVIREAEIDLFTELDYVSGPNLPLYFNLHLLLALMSETTESYEDITIEISKDKSRKDQQAFADDDRLQCCCSKPIHLCFIINGPYGEMLVGCDCIEKNNFTTSKEINQLKREIEERDMTPQERAEKEEKKRINKEKQQQKREVERKKKEEEKLKEFHRHIEELRMREEEQKQRYVEYQNKLEEERQARIKEFRMREEKRKKTLEEEREQRLEEAIQKKKYNLENCICNKCGKHFPNQGTYELCFPCTPKCECGNILSGNFAKCFTCNQLAKKDICISCKRPFDGKGKFKQCFPCKKASEHTLP